MNHTLGPWSVKYQWHVMAGDKLVANTGGHTDNFTPDLPQINAANARLIAAAPDLLAALKAMYDECECDPFSPATDLARAAIAKATS